MQRALNKERGAPRALFLVTNNSVPYYLSITIAILANYANHAFNPTHRRTPDRRR